MLQHLICILCGLKTPDRNSFFLPKFDVFPRESFYVILFTFSPLSFINVLNCTNPSTEFSVLLPACDKLYSEIGNVQTCNQWHLQHKGTPLCKCGI